MKSLKKKALQQYQSHEGNYQICTSFPLKKEEDLATMYYPGINDVIEKIEKKPANQHKFCSLPFSVGVISSCKTTQYPIISAKAALLSHVAALNAIPLTLKYGKPQNIPTILNQLSPNFQAYYVTNVSQLEEEIIRDNIKKIDRPVIFHTESMALGVIASALAAARMMKSKPAKVHITLEGSDRLAKEITAHLKSYKFSNITLLDEDGPLYAKKPMMNRDKIELVNIIKSKKDHRSRDEVLGATEIYISTMHQNISSQLSSKLNAKATIIALNSEEIVKQSKQSLISTLPHLENHISDLHIAAIMLSAACIGKDIDGKTLKKATESMANFHPTPKGKKIIPGLLDKKLVTKGLKKM
ncbi:MAG: hypothetical protein P1V18_04090 [Candidatus Gracilibacteria bacterium]|nr:hypothetical protein [Candidatus Gracilibacteria bacterium]